MYKRKKCDNCKLIGHMSNECWKLHSKKRPKRDTKNKQDDGLLMLPLPLDKLRRFLRSDLRNGCRCHYRYPNDVGHFATNLHREIAARIVVETRMRNSGVGMLNYSCS